MIKVIYIFILVALLKSCAFPQFSFKAGGKGGEEIPGRTIQIDYFENRSDLASANASNFFTESLKDLMQSQTKLSLVSEKGDWVIDGQINTYKVVPISIQANSESAALNRFTMGVVANCKFIKPNGEDSLVIENKQFTFYSDFESTLDFSAQEESLQKEVVDQITQAIFDNAFGGEW